MTAGALQTCAALSCLVRAVNDHKFLAPVHVKNLTQPLKQVERQPSEWQGSPARRSSQECGVGERETAEEAHATNASFPAGCVAQGRGSRPSSLLVAAIRGAAVGARENARPDCAEGKRHVVAIPERGRVFFRQPQEQPLVVLPWYQPSSVHSPPSSTRGPTCGRGECARLQVDWDRPQAQVVALVADRLSLRTPEIQCVSYHDGGVQALFLKQSSFEIIGRHNCTPRMPCRVRLVSFYRATGSVSDSSA